jgi:hypothetical protein
LRTIFDKLHLVESCIKLYILVEYLGVSYLGVLLKYFRLDEFLVERKKVGLRGVIACFELQFAMMSK